MGKKSMSKDRHHRHRVEDGGRRIQGQDGGCPSVARLSTAAQVILPFEDPVCTADGTVKDIMHAVPMCKPTASIR